MARNYKVDIQPIANDILHLHELPTDEERLQKVDDWTAAIAQNSDLIQVLLTGQDLRDEVVEELRSEAVELLARVLKTMRQALSSYGEHLQKLVGQVRELKNNASVETWKEFPFLDDKQKLRLTFLGPNPPLTVLRQVSNEYENAQSFKMWLEIYLDPTLIQTKSYASLFKWLKTLAALTDAVFVPNPPLVGEKEDWRKVVQDTSLTIEFIEGHYEDEIYEIRKLIGDFPDPAVVIDDLNGFYEKWPSPNSLNTIRQESTEEIKAYGNGHMARFQDEIVKIYKHKTIRVTDKISSELIGRAFTRVLKRVTDSFIQLVQWLEEPNPSKRRPAQILESDSSSSLSSEEEDSENDEIQIPPDPRPPVHVPGPVPRPVQPAPQPWSPKPFVYAGLSTVPDPTPAWYNDQGVEGNGPDARPAWYRSDLDIPNAQKTQMHFPVIERGKKRPRIPTAQDQLARVTTYSPELRRVQLEADLERKAMLEERHRERERNRAEYRAFLEEQKRMNAAGIGSLYF